MADAHRRVGRFLIEREIGRGGMAVVYVARQVDLDRAVALKELPGFRASDPASAARFLRESRMLGAMSHPNIVTVFDYFVHDEIPYFAMEYVERGSLRPYVDSLSLAQIAGVLEGLFSGLAYGHQAGIVHRDLKPENIMVSAEGWVKIADFGIAKTYDQETFGLTLTETGITVGTPAYMAPEQAMAQDVSPATDLYSAGVMAYEMLVGKLPFGDTRTPFAILMRHVHDPPPPPRSLNPDLDPRLESWLEHLLAKDPKNRPRSATEAWEEFEEVVLDELGPRWRRGAQLPRLAAADKHVGAAIEEGAPEESPSRAPPVLADASPPEAVEPAVEVPPPPAEEPVADPIAAPALAAPRPQREVVPPDEWTTIPPSVRPDQRSFEWPTPSAGPRRRKAIAIAAGGGVILAAGAGAAALISGGGGGGPTTTRPPTTITSTWSGPVLSIVQPLRDRSHGLALATDGATAYVIARSGHIVRVPLAHGDPTPAEDAAAPSAVLETARAVYVGDSQGVAAYSRGLGSLSSRAGSPVMALVATPGGTRAVTANGKLCSVIATRIGRCRKLGFTTAWIASAGDGRGLLATRQGSRSLLRVSQAGVVSALGVLPQAARGTPVSNAHTAFVPVSGGIAVAALDGKARVRVIRLGSTPSALILSPSNDSVLAALPRAGVVVAVPAKPGTYRALVGNSGSARSLTPVALARVPHSTDVLILDAADAPGIVIVDAASGKIRRRIPLAASLYRPVQPLAFRTLELVDSTANVTGKLSFANGTLSRDDYTTDGNIGLGWAKLTIVQRGIRAVEAKTVTLGQLTMHVKPLAGKLVITMSVPAGVFSSLTPGLATRRVVKLVLIYTQTATQSHTHSNSTSGITIH